MSKQWAQKKSGSNSSLPVQKSSSSQRPFTAPVYDAPAPKQTPSVQAKRRNVDWNRVTVEAQSPAGVQAKLSVGAPGDKYEQEADAMANKVMTMPAPENEKPLQREMAPEEKEEEVQTKPLANSIQREMVPEEKEEEVQTKPLANSIQREMVPEEKEEEVQTKPATEGKSQAGSNLESQLSGTKGGGSALSDEVRSHMEPRFGADFSSVRVHTDSAAVQMNRDLGAQAFTHGSDIYYGGGKSPGKDELTAHELTHVVQQNGGAVQRAPLIQRIGEQQDTEAARKWPRFKRWIKRRIGGKKLPAEDIQQVPAEDIQQVNPEDFRDYMELNRIKGEFREISQDSEAGHIFLVTFTLKNKSEKRIEFTNTPPVEWIETESKVNENTPDVHFRRDMYTLNPNSNTFMSWRSVFTNQQRWNPGETKNVYIQDGPRIRGINEDGRPPRTVWRTLIFDIGVPGTGPRLRATQHINVVRGAKQGVNFTID
ncbi:eCIS core domain-containing protein [Microcoleus vaginatus]|uniref:eCIS core domain-containing protein n=1 Tax=Microcoleus vaginatus TaxID=119532 RepID=UPI0032A46163